MGQKTHPIGFRIGVIRDWNSKWFASKRDYTQLLHEDIRIKDYIKKRYASAGISKVVVERMADKVKVRVFAARPGIIIGRKGAEVEQLKKDIEYITGGKDVVITVDEVRVPELDAQLVAEEIALQIERRVSHRRAMKRAIDNAFKAGAKGVKVQVKGRIGGAELARAEWFLVGRMPLQTLRADIDYGFAVAQTKYGVLGIKVWIYKGDVLKGGKEEIVKKIEEDLKKAEKEV
ncbi:MAG: 30S ribosomal protein S3 [Aquificota bacterium]|jgi:small subunit ribosomal protein S3|nr:30S ribosomal protein S3 [Aquificaceae bacterium]QWK13096.1 MAG: 30S ribosomal protein S3 [Aquificota bacterium]HAV40242.1 30S ribosomal protein S3 [Aquificaceae bacterium]HCO39115.1 30S ribosomal protein S3 [Aquificaceae bacterium]